ncbi:hypothetical protein BTVI_10308 [Pitangus sulphuratus]|nr:hypothetical protein BTVI_10308 [Pitangus sulphuratus]
MFDITSKAVGGQYYLISDYVELPSFCALIDPTDYSKAVANLRQILFMPHLCQGKYEVKGRRDEEESTGLWSLKVKVMDLQHKMEKP